MEYITDININEAIIHILDNTSEDPILNEYKLELTDDIYKFLYKHIDRAFKDEELRYAVFNDERNIVKEISQEYLHAVNTDLVDVSKEIARQMFSIMKGNGSIPSCDLMVVGLSTDMGPMLGVLKLDYVKNFTHSVDFIDDKIGINIVPQLSGLPASSGKVQKCAFIKPVRENTEVHLMVIDKGNKSKEEEYGANYFINNFLGCTVVTNERDMTKTFLKAAETWTRNNVLEDADNAERIRTTIKSKLKEEEEINVDKLAHELFWEQPEVKQEFNQYIANQGIDQIVAVDKQWVEKKLKRVRLNIDKEIDMYINEDTYHDSERVEIQRNGDGSINIVIRNVKNYIEK